MASKKQDITTLEGLRAFATAKNLPGEHHEVIETIRANMAAVAASFGVSEEKLSEGLDMWKDDEPTCVSRLIAQCDRNLKRRRAARAAERLAGAHAAFGAVASSAVDTGYRLELDVDALLAAATDAPAGTHLVIDRVGADFAMRIKMALLKKVAGLKKANLRAWVDLQSGSRTRHCLVFSWGTGRLTFDGCARGDYHPEDGIAFVLPGGHVVASEAA